MAERCWYWTVDPGPVVGPDKPRDTEEAAAAIAVRYAVDEAIGNQMYDWMGLPRQELLPVERVVEDFADALGNYVVVRAGWTIDDGLAGRLAEVAQRNGGPAVPISERLATGARRNGGPAAPIVEPGTGGPIPPWALESMGYCQEDFDVWEPCATARDYLARGIGLGWLPEEGEPWASMRAALEAGVALEDVLGW